MKPEFYAALLYPADEAGLYGVVVPDVRVNASGTSPDEALQDAITILQEVVDDLSAAGEDIPKPSPVECVHDGDAQRLLLPVILPSKSVRINVTLPDSLIQRIDAVAPNRSAFLAESALLRLRSDS